MKNKKGFTVLELVICICIMFILFALGAGIFSKSMKKNITDPITNTITETHDPNKLEKLE